MAVINKTEQVAEHVTEQMRARGLIYAVGLGQGEAVSPTQQAAAALARATVIIGYSTYVERVSQASSQAERRAYDNGSERQRARDAIEAAMAGEIVAVVCGGDSGVYGMAARLFEERARHEDARDAINIEVVPGVTAAQAVAARFGAPLGDDFCVLTLSDRLRDGEEILARLEAALRADFTVAIYNPAGKERRSVLLRAVRIMREVCGLRRCIALARRVGFADESSEITTVASLNLATIDMSTLLIVPASHIRVDSERKLMYPPSHRSRTR